MCVCSTTDKKRERLLALSTEMAYRAHLLVLVLLAGAVWVSNGGVIFEDKESAREAGKEAPPSSSWTDWAKGKISEGLGMKEDPASGSPKAQADEDSGGRFQRTAKDAASSFLDDATAAASDAVKYMADKGREEAEEAKEGARRLGEEMDESVEWAKGKAEEGMDAAGAMPKKAAVAQERKEQMQWAQDKSTESYDDLKGKPSVAREAKEKAKTGYDAAKDIAEETINLARSKAGETTEGTREKVKDKVKEKLGGDKVGSFPAEEEL